MSQVRYLEKQGARPLQVHLVEAGTIDERYCGTEVLSAARLRHDTSRDALPYDGWRLSAGEPAIPTRMVDIFPGDDAAA